MPLNDPYALPFAPTDRPAMQRACKQFHDEYQPILHKVETHLHQMTQKTDPVYAQAYKPWLKALCDICTGVFLLSKGIPLPDPAALLDALRMFSFDSTLQLLHDLCISCKLVLEKEWTKKFRRDIDIMLFAAANLQQQQQGITR